MTDNITSELKDFKNNVDIDFDHWFNFAVKFREEVNTVPSVLRLVKSWNRFRPNVENDDSLSYCKKSLAIPFLNDINSQLQYRLEDRNHIEIFATLPSIMFKRDYNLEITVKILLEKYHNEMANEGALFRSELKRRSNFSERKLNNVSEEIQGASKVKKRFDGKPGFTFEDPSDDIIEASNFADTDFFPNIRKLLILGSTSHIGPTEAEKDASGIR